MLEKLIRSIRTNFRSIEVISIIDKHPNGITAFDIANEVGCNVPYVNAILIKLMREGYLTYSTENGCKLWKGVVD
jgi:DNA-binding IclR family transcriptional regulator